jgi:uncharacterized protein YqgV (UPF0045/DUF77 family)
MVSVSAQVSIYPLRQEHISPAIAKVQVIFQEHGLDTNPGPMSTLILGSGETVFAALQNAFERVSELGPVVMVVTLSNACPLPKNQGQEPGKFQSRESK